MNFANTLDTYETSFIQLENNEVDTPFSKARKIHDSWIGKRYEGKEFEYEEEKEKKKEKNNSIDLDPNFDFLAKFRTLLKWLLIIVFCIALLFILYKLINNGGFAVFSRDKNNSKVYHEEEEIEDIHSIDFSKQIAVREKEENYRAAIRWHFLQKIHSLEESNCIVWKPKKTNHDYLHEIKDLETQKAFREIVRIYNHFWFGEYPVDSEDYQKIKRLFQNFQPAKEIQK
jgi:hypothetical protein